MRGERVGMTHANLYERACRVIPGGVNSPVRAFNGVGGTPLYVVSGNGARIKSAEGRELIDFCCSWGAMILGHAHAEITEVLAAQAAQGVTFGINTPAEVEFAEKLCTLVPQLEQVRLVSSGTEAVMTALRVARGVTGRRKIIKFDGCYHGHSDTVLVAAGSGLLTGGHTSSLGVPPQVASDTYVVPYNAPDLVGEVVREIGKDLAAIIVEPLAGNMGLVMPEPDFLRSLRSAASECGALLIFDEVISGFRFQLSSFAQRVGIAPDLITLGKIIGGGLPLAAVGGKAQFMQHLAPLGKIYQAGTLSGNPLAVAAGLKTLALLERDNPYPHLAELGSVLATMINEAATANELNLHCAQYQGVFTIYHTKLPVSNLSESQRSDTAAYARLFHGLLERGFYIAPSQFELGFISAAHTLADVVALGEAVVEISLAQRG